MERIYSFNPGALTGPVKQLQPISPSLRPNSSVKVEEEIRSTITSDTITSAKEVMFSMALVS